MENTAAVAEPTAQAEPVVEKVESKVVETPPLEEKPSSGKLLELARKEAEFVRKEVARKEEIAKLQEQLRGYEEEVGYYRKAKESYKANPEELLTKLGITYDELTEAVIDYYDNKTKSPTVPDAESIRKEIEAQYQKVEAEKLAAQTEAAVQGFVEEITQFVEGNGDKFPHLTQLYKPLGQTETPEQLLFSIVENYYRETGELLSIEAAAGAAEEHFREEWNKINGTLQKAPTSPPAPRDNKTENKVAPPAEERNGGEVVVNKAAFRVTERPSLSNNFAKPVSRVPYRGSNVERRDIIEKAVAAMEAAASGRK